jgi:site-specific recombinase XerD
MKQSDKELIGYWLRRYLTEYLPVVRNLSRNTITSYRDALRQLLEYVTENGLSPDKLRVEELTSELVASFLLNLERAKTALYRREITGFLPYTALQTTSQHRNLNTCFGIQN